jgi:hypothetical protein
MHDNDVPTEPAEARRQPVDHAYGASSEWLADRFEQHRPRPRAVAYRMLGNKGRNISYGEVVRWFQGWVSIALDIRRRHIGG